uniref:Putative conserved secreted protein n=1 Tax=Amblyomma tuberculatum TaxID=48802 RepID=A0A6M2E2V8_9ACAR
MTGPLGAPALTATALATRLNAKHRTSARAASAGAPQMHSSSSLSHALIWHPRNRPCNQRRHPLYNQKYKLIISQTFLPLLQRRLNTGHLGQPSKKKLQREHRQSKQVASSKRLMQPPTQQEGCWG